MDITKLTQQYLDEYADYIYITDHAIIRYLERVLDLGTHTLNGSEEDKVNQYLKIAGMSGKSIRDTILTRGEQRTIMQQQISRYSKDGMIYIIKNLTLITIVPDEVHTVTTQHKG